MRTKDLIAVFGSVHAVRMLWTPPLSKSAIYQWGDDVPALRVYQIREKVPDIDERIAIAIRAQSKAKTKREARAA